MNQLTLHIAGRNYRVSCEDGQEARITQLGAQIDQRLQSLGLSLVQNDAKHLLLAGLVLADELEDAQDSSSRNSSSRIDASPDKAQAEHDALIEERDALRRERDALAEQLASAEQDKPQTLTFGVAANRELERQNQQLAEELESIAEALEQSADTLEKARP